MAIASTTVWEMRTAGSVNNGGGYNASNVTAGTDFSQQDAAQVTYTDLAIDVAVDTNVTSVLNPFLAVHVGNIIKVTGGTGFTVGWYEVVSLTGVIATLDRTVGTVGSTGGTGNLGGAVFSDSDAFYEQLIGDNIVWVKAGTYTQTAAVSAAINSQTILTPINVFGYNAARADNPTGTSRPIITCGANTFNFLGDNWAFKNIRITGTGTIATNQGSNSHTNMYFENTSGTANRDAFRSNTSETNMLVSCEFSTNAGYGFTNLTSTVSRLFDCYFHGGARGINATAAQMTLINCIFVGHTESGYRENGTMIAALINNTFDGQNGTGTALDLSASSGLGRSVCVNNIFYNWTKAIDVLNPAPSSLNYFDYNDFFSNGTDRTNITAGAHDVALDPQFTNEGAGDYSIGTNLKAKGLPGVFPLTTTTGYMDIGAVQRQESGGTSSGGTKQIRFF